MYAKGLTMTTNNHPAHGPVSLDRLHQIREILSKASAQSDGGNLGYAMADAVKAIDEVLVARNAEPVFFIEIEGDDWIQAGRIPGSTFDFNNLPDGINKLFATPPVPVVPDEKCDDDGNTTSEFDYGWNACRTAMLQGKAEPASEPCKLREQVRREHAAWSLATFGDVGPVGPLKHLSKEALEAAAEPGDLSEWADMQFLLWDAQRRAGISDEQITLAMVEKLAVNKQREWPEPKDGEPRLHIKKAGNSPVTLDTWIPVSERMPEKGQEVLCTDQFHNYETALYDIGYIPGPPFFATTAGEFHPTHWMPLPAAPRQEDL
jgi:hypothetical protein